MRGAATRPAKARGKNINLRVSHEQKSLIDRAVRALGRNRSDFMLETACQEAETVLLDRRYFSLPVEEFRRFAAILDKPPASNPRLTRLLSDPSAVGQVSAASTKASTGRLHKC